MPHDHNHGDAGRSGYDLWAEPYDITDNPVVALDAKHALRILTPQPGELVLDAGCGTGRNFPGIAAAGATAVGIDSSLSMLWRCPAAGSSLAAADLEGGLPFAPDTFDAVLCSLVGEHLDELVACLSEFARVLKPSGRLVFSALHPDEAAARLEAKSARHVGDHGPRVEHHSVQDYLDAVVDAGFDEVACASFKGGTDSGKYEGQPLLFLVAATTFPAA